MSSYGPRMLAVLSHWATYWSSKGQKWSRIESKWLGQSDPLLEINK